MKLKRVCLSFILASILSGGYTYATENGNNPDFVITDTTDGDYIIHIVSKGETIFSIASKYNTAIAEIYKLNPDSEKGIKAGDIIRIPKTKKVTYTEHKIKPKETLFGVSKLYGITLNELLSANPGLNESEFKVGNKIRIPNGGVKEMRMHIVEKGETLFSISKLYDVPMAEIIANNGALNNNGRLKVGMELSIPVVGQPGETKTETVVTNPIVDSKNRVNRIGILLPFLQESSTISKDKIVEYYDGLLLSTRTMKERGLNAEIYTFEIGGENDTKYLENLMESTEMKSLDLIIGGVSKKQISLLSDFSKKQNIKYVIPFGSQNTEITSNPNTYQVINSHSNLYGKISSTFKNRFRNHNIIFVQEQGSNNNKMDFVAELKKELTISNIPYKSITSSSSLSNDLKKYIDNSKSNIIIPTSSSEASLRRITPVLKSANITLFGYPEWQTYTHQIGTLHKFDTYIYSSFFLNEGDYDVTNFISQYKKWFNRPLINSYPKFGCLGYDTGMFFLNGLNKYGSSFDNYLSTLKINTLQTGMNFEKTIPSGGYINNAIYLIHYNSNMSIEKIECK